jgi:hypothetical protein
MTEKAIHAWLFPILSLAVGLAMPWFGLGVPFMGLLMGPPDTNSFPAYGAPALITGLFGFLRAKPKEIWGYGFLIWAPQIIGFGMDWALHPAAWFRGYPLILAASSFLAAVVAALASYAGFALRKVASRIGSVPEEPPSILRK